MKETTVQAIGQTPNRFDIYALIHKGLRAFMCDVMITVGRADADDEKDVTAVLAKVRELADYCEGHLRHENHFVHAALEARRPGSSEHTAEEHYHHEWAISQIRSLADDVDSASGNARVAALSALYRYLALFVAENFTHMNIEETENNAALWATHSDEEIMNIERALISKLKPQEMAISMRWMLPAMTPQERAAKLAGTHAGAPAPAFEALLGIAHTHLSPRDWNKLSEALGLAEQLAA
jgi:hypothetical protein